MENKVKDFFDKYLPMPTLADGSSFIYGVMFSMVAFTVLRFLSNLVVNVELNFILNYLFITPSFESIVVLFILVFSFWQMDVKLSSLQGLYKFPAIFIGLNYILMGLGYHTGYVQQLFNILIWMVIISFTVHISIKYKLVDFVRKIKRKGKKK